MIRYPPHRGLQPNLTNKQTRKLKTGFNQLILDIKRFGFFSVLAMRGTLHLTYGRNNIQSDAVAYENAVKFNINLPDI